MAGSSSTGASSGSTGASSGSTATGSAGSAGAAGTSTASSSKAIDTLQKTGTRWAAATVGSSTAGDRQFDSGEPVRGIGGFDGGDPAPTPAEFQAYVKAGDVGYFVSDGAERSGADLGGDSETATWVAANYSPTTVGNLTVYDLQP